MGSSSIKSLFSAEPKFIAGVSEESCIYPMFNSYTTEVAFWGRSNVGKSSLINTLTGKKNLAHVSNTPGRTQQINFFQLNPKLVLVDLPGYGYAKAAKAKQNQWSRLISHYLQTRRQLKRLFLLIDGRREGLTEIDQQVVQWLNEIPIANQIIITKVDKVKSLESLILGMQESIQPFISTYPEVIAVSSANNYNIPTLRNTIFHLI